MNKKFESAVGAVKAHLETNRYCYSIKMGYLRCYRLFKQHLSDTGEPYSRELSGQWLQSIAPGLCKPTFKVYKLALEKLDSAYHQKEIGDAKTRYCMQTKHNRLAPWCQDVLNEFLTDISGTYDSSSYRRTIEFSVTRFLEYLTNKGIHGVDGISHRIVVGYYRDDDCDNYKLKDMYNNCIRKFLQYLSEKCAVQESIPMSLDKFVISRLVFIESLPKEIQEEFNINAQGVSTSAEEYYSASLEVDKHIERHKYSKSIKKTFHKTWKEFYVFLEANSLSYSKETALTWATYMSHHTVQWRSFRRALMLFEQYKASGQVNPGIIYTYSPDRANKLPEWCKADYEAFMRLKSQEGFAKSTLDMYRSSCLRLLEYLCAASINSWDAVTPETLKTFHYQDIHSTPEGKNAYSSKIRIFMEHLGESGRVPASLYLAVPSESAPRVSLIPTLDDDDIANLYQFRYHKDDGYNLRAVAMILIGLRMGLRASDITKLKFSDISWEHKTISVQQQKTGKFLKLPMPVEVGNALYLYIIEGRPEASSEYVFITHRVPFNKLHRAVCSNTLLKALPDNPHGFHIARKTFASRMLVKDVGTDRIAETLGHVDNSTVMRYLSTNGDKMRKCALPLVAIPVEGGILS